MHSNFIEIPLAGPPIWLCGQTRHQTRWSAHLCSCICCTILHSVSCANDLLTGSVDLMHWTCMIPGKNATPWEKGLFPLELEFTEAYPSKPPDCRFPKGFFHPNGGLLFVHISTCGRTKRDTQHLQSCHFVCSVPIGQGMSLHCECRPRMEASY